MVAEEAAEEAILVVEMVERRLLIGWLVEVGWLDELRELVFDVYSLVDRW